MQVSPAEQESVVERFLAAGHGGGLQELLDVPHRTWSRWRHCRRGPAADDHRAGAASSLVIVDTGERLRTLLPAVNSAPITGSATTASSTASCAAKAARSIVQQYASDSRRPTASHVPAASSLHAAGVPS